MAKLAKERGVDMLTNSEVSELITDGNKISGVKLQSGQVYEAPIVISNATHHVTFNNLIHD